MGKRTRPIILSIIMMLLTGAVLPVAAAQEGTRSSIGKPSSTKQPSAVGKPRDQILAMSFKDGRLSVWGTGR